MSFASIGRRREEPCTPDNDDDDDEDDDDGLPSRRAQTAAPRARRSNDNIHEDEKNHENNNNNDDDEDEWLFSCRCESAKAVTTLLSCLQQQHQHSSSHHHSSVMTTTTPLDRRDVVTPSPHRRGGGGGGPPRNSNTASSFSTIQPVLVFCSPTHLTFHVHGKVCQSSVDMPAGLFSQFAIFPNQQHQQPNQRRNRNHDNGVDSDEWQASGEFCVNLNTVLDCCQALGTLYLDQTKLGWSYNVTKEMLQIELMMNETTTTTTNTTADPEATSRHRQQQQQQQPQQNHSTQVLCTAALPGLVPPDWNTSAASSLALAFRSSPMSARIIVPSSILREAMTELELVPAAALTTVQVTFSLPEGLQLSVVGPTSECLVTLPASHARGGSANKVTMELLLPPPQPVMGRQQQNHQVLCHVYPWNSWRNAMKALDIATETCLSMNQHGMMAIQHQVILMGDDSHPCFCDYIMCCLNDDDDDEEEEHGETMDSQTTTSLPAAGAAAAGRGVSQDSSASSFSLGWNRNRDATQESSPGNSNLLRPIHNDRRDAFVVGANHSEQQQPHVADDDDDDDDDEEEEWGHGDQRQHQQDQNDDEDDDRDMDDAALVPPAPLFGSVLRMVHADEQPEPGRRRPTSSSASSMRQRRRLRRPASDHEDRSSTSSSSRRRLTRSRAQQEDDDDHDDDDDHHHRRHRQNNNNNDDDESDQDMPLDITENDVSSPARTRQRKGGDRGCSSPEIVYGK